MTTLKGVPPPQPPAAANPADLSCPLPLPQVDHVVLGHGSGGLLTHRMIRDVFLEAFDNPALRRGDDAAVLALEKPGRLALTTDAHIVSPLFFPGGDIGRLAICGTVNDLAVLGAQPRWLTASFILEEGLAMADLRRVVDSMRRAADEAGVQVVAGDTKVAERGKADGLFIQTTGVGTIPDGRDVGGARARPGDAVFVSGPLGDHGLAVLAARGQLGFTIDVESDVAPLNGLVEALFASGAEIARDAGPHPRRIGDDVERDRPTKFRLDHARGRRHSGAPGGGLGLRTARLRPFVRRQRRALDRHLHRGLGRGGLGGDAG